MKVEIRSFSITCTYRSFDLIKEGGNESRQRKSLEKIWWKGRRAEYFSEEEKNKKDEGSAIKKRGEEGKERMEIAEITRREGMKMVVEKKEKK